MSGQNIFTSDVLVGVIAKVIAVRTGISTQRFLPGALSDSSKTVTILFGRRNPEN